MHRADTQAGTIDRESFQVTGSPSASPDALHREQHTSPCTCKVASVQQQQERLDMPSLTDWQRPLWPSRRPCSSSREEL